MSNYRSFATTRTGRKRIFTTFPEYFQQIMKNRQFFFSHPKMDFSWSAMLVHKIRTCTREIYVVSEPEYSVHWIICVSLLPQNRKHLRATAGRIHVDPIFPKAREYPCTYVSCSLPIKIYMDIWYFKLKWQLKHLFKFWMEFDGNRKSHPFSSSGYTRIKGKIQLLSSLLILCTLTEIASPTACDQG